MPLSVMVVLFVASPAIAETPIRLIPPVDAAVVDAFEAPASEYGPGHRGIDYAAVAGTRIRAAAAGTVTFAGSVAGTRAVAVEHVGGVETTYTGLSVIDVARGERVSEGTFIGTSGSVHGRDGLHFGVKIDGAYVDPVELLVDFDVAGAIHLAPLRWTPDLLGGLGTGLAQPRTAGSSERACRPSQPLVAPERPPNDNIVVAVAGIRSKTRGGMSAEIYESGPELLGYAPDSIYRFSYAGTAGRRFHEPYDPSDTYIDIRTAAARLRSLMVKIARRHPGRDVDLIAHSLGGVVARTYLTLAARSGEATPNVDHLVTLASPHRGAPIAGISAPLRDATLTGGLLLEGAAALSEAGIPLPHPDADSVRQLAPGSELLTSLDREDVTFGTRVLSLAIPNDLVVPADHALYPGGHGRIVPWRAGAAGHSAIVVSPDAHGIAYAFLADRAPTCMTKWDRIGPGIGDAVSSIESSLAPLHSAFEGAVLGPLGTGAGRGRAHLVYRAQPQP